MLYPMCAMVLLTLCIGIVAARARFSSVRTGKLKPGYFRDMQSREGMNVPDRVIITTRCFNNMFELPVLFYVACVSAIALGLVNGLLMITAWAFVLSRCIHTWIHLTYNHILHRMRTYWLGAIVVLALWIELIALSVW